ncbi:MAG: hypothetical protein IT178_13150 [Acidobacteria bacterium]|nr:hypothetical protein [Acidobacteriota bacterium]
MERVVYFKQETLVLASIAPLFDALATAPVVMTPHLPFPLRGPDAGDREQVILQSGVYNVGVLGVSNHPVARRLLDWWHQRLLTHCRHDVPNGMHFEQRWLDLAPAFFDGVQVLGDPSFNIGHWSLPERTITRDANGEALVDGAPLRVFRFSGFDPDAPDRITRYHDRLSWDSLGEVQRLIASVREALFNEGHAEVRTWPYAYATFDSGVPIPTVARRLYLEMGEAARRFGNPFATAGEDSYWHWLRDHAPGTEVSRLWAAVHAERPDLQQAFPDLTGAGAVAFMNWARQFGVAEHRIDAQWVQDALSDREASSQFGRRQAGGDQNGRAEENEHVGRKVGGTEGRGTR